MRIFTLLLFLITVFIANIGLYYVSETYRSFLQNIKNEDKNIIASDEYSIEPSEITNTLNKELNEELDKEISLKYKEYGIVEKEENTQGKIEEIASIKIKNVESKQLKMSAYEKEILFLFGEYNFTKLNSHWSLLDLTSEYPEEYFEYYLPDLTLIFFSTKTYNQVKEVFEVEQDNWNYKLNEVDNFWDESFYLNFDPGFDDWYIRIVFTKKWKVFWLKISKNEYTSVKNILKSL